VAFESKNGASSHRYICGYGDVAYKNGLAGKKATLPHPFPANKLGCFVRFAAA